jgi:hypothetical protein
MKTFFKRLFCKHIWKKSLSFYNGCEMMTISVCEKCLKKNNVSRLGEVAEHKTSLELQIFKLKIKCQ